jgi:hypothetical protein
VARPSRIPTGFLRTIAVRRGYRLGGRLERVGRLV